MKQIPNLFTLLNLLLGCLAVVFILQTGETIVLLDQGGMTQVMLPERIWWGSLLIFAAAAVDFLDGFLARMLKAHSEMGRQLDSLSDMVSFGVAPGMILYQLLRISYAREEGGLDTALAYLLPAFLFTAAVAWRLARFNIRQAHDQNFRGMPSPAAGLLVASFPLIIWFRYFDMQELFISKWLLYGVIILASYLMISNIRFLGLKFRDFSFRNNIIRYILLALALIAVVLLNWLAVPVIFILYILFSLLVREESSPAMERDTLDVTV